MSKTLTPYNASLADGTDVYCPMVDSIARTADGFCQFCGKTDHKIYYSSKIVAEFCGITRTGGDAVFTLFAHGIIFFGAISMCGNATSSAPFETEDLARGWLNSKWSELGITRHIA